VDFLRLAEEQEGDDKNQLRQGKEVVGLAVVVLGPETHELPSLLDWGLESFWL